MKRLMKAALVLLLAMALTLVACDPKVNEPEPRHGEPLWHEEPITVDNAAADIRAFFNEIEKQPYGINLSPDLAILNLVGRPLAQLDKDALITKLTGSDLTAAFEDDADLMLSETLAEDVELGDGFYKNKGVYNMIQDGATGDWTITVSRPDNAEWGFEATLAKDKERGCFVSVETYRDDPRIQSKATFYPSVCAYNEVVLASGSVHHSKDDVTTEDGEVKQVERKEIQTITLYFADKNIGDGDKIFEQGYTDFEDGVKQKAYSQTVVSGHDKDGILIFRLIDKTTYPKEIVEYLRKIWFPASDGQLQIPKALRDLGIPSFTIKAGSVFTTFDDMNQTFDVIVGYDRITNKPQHASCYLTTTKTLEEVKSLFSDKHFELDPDDCWESDDYVNLSYKVDGALDDLSVNVYDKDSPVRISIDIKDDPATEANELAPFVALVN